MKQQNMATKISMYNYTIRDEVNKVTLSETELEKYLGIFIDTNLYLKKHNINS